MTQLLLYGGTGFIGQALARRYLQEEIDCHVTLVGHAPHGVHADLASDPRLEVIDAHIDTNAPFDQWNEGKDIVFHLLSSTVPINSGKHYGKELQDIPLTAELIDSCLRVGAGRFVFISSAGSIYGDTRGAPVNEDAPCNPLSAYAYQKLAIEELVKYFGRVEGLDYRIVRLSNPYGAGQAENGVQGVIPVFIARILEDQPLVIRGNGGSSRDYVLLEDAVNAIRNIASDVAAHKVYNVGSGESATLLDVVNAVEEATGREAILEFTPAPDTEVSLLALDVSRYEREFGAIQSKSLSDGVKEVAELLIAHRF